MIYTVLYFLLFCLSLNIYAVSLRLGIWVLVFLMAALHYLGSVIVFQLVPLSGHLGCFQF